MSKKTLLLSTLLCLFPIAIGLLLWGQLPPALATHWNAAGEVDGTMPRIAAILGLPLFLAAVHLFTLFMVSFDPNQKEKNRTFIQYLYWFVPILCNLCMFATYATALGYALNVTTLILVAVGLLFVLIGYMLKKVEPNYTMGLRLPWTLHSEENWKRTHAFASPIWMLGGALMAICGFFPMGFILILPITLILIAVPTVYSFMLYRKGI